MQGFKSMAHSSERKAISDADLSLFAIFYICRYKEEFKIRCETHMKLAPVCTVYATCLSAA